MAALFRTWAETPPSPPEEPDLVLQVGGARFAAHSRLLAAHSGYFKSLLPTRPTLDDVVFVPNVTPQQFWPLFAYVYTGYLDLTPENIYQVLLATHLLHMPRALELCRDYLAQGGGAPLPPPPTIIKPIPSRRLPPCFQPLLPAPERAPFRPESVLSTVANSPTSEKRCPDSDDSVDVLGTPSPSPAPTVEKKQKKKKEAEKPTTVKMKSSNGEKVVIDVACCDGPVQFHRVLNEAYKTGSGTRMEPVECSDTEDCYIEIEEDSSPPATPFDNSSAFSKSLQKQMTEDIRKRDENQETIYTCIYCEHTFKSQYCYQKHAKRHINPMSIDTVDQDPALPSRKTTTKREVRLLDMNVQYYPCKSCGSKFPSYYFVHKHRKMCHAEELDVGDEARKTQGKKTPKTNNTDTPVAK